MDNNDLGGLIALPTRLEGEQVKRLFDDLVESRRINDLLRAEVNTLKQNESALQGELEALRYDLMREIALDRQRIAKLEHPVKELGQTSIDRAKRIDHYMESRPDHKASYESLRGWLGINSVLLNLSIAALIKMHPGKYARAQDKVNKRNRWLVVVPRVA